MSSKHLSVVTGEGPLGGEPGENSDAVRSADAVAERVRNLQDEARLLAREEIAALENQLILAAHIADAIARGGEAYPVGIRAMAEQIASDLPLRVRGLKAIMERVGRS